MRRVKYFFAASLDGFVAEPDGGIDWLFQDGDYGLTAFYQTIDTVFMGRKTHDVGIKYGMSSYEGLKNYVFTRGHPAEPVADVEYVSGDPANLVGRLRKEPGNDMWLVGGGELAAAFFAAGLIDDVAAAIHPIILGTGIPLSERIPASVPLELVDTVSYETGLVTLSYRVRRSSEETPS